MDSADLEVNRAVRRILVRHWIDLGRLSIRTRTGKVQLQGRFSRIAGVQDSLSAAIMQTIHADIKRIRGVLKIAFLLENWTNHSGIWQPVDDGVHARDLQPICEISDEAPPSWSGLN